MTDDAEKLEQLVDSLARAQPARRAPVCLQARVFAQIASQQVQLPWWRKGFAHWPLAARAMFLVASYGFIRLAIRGCRVGNRFCPVIRCRGNGDVAASG